GSTERKNVEQQVLKARADYELHGKKIKEDLLDSESKIILTFLADMNAELERYAKANQVRLILRNDPTPPDLSDPRMILQELNKPIVYQRGNDVTASVLEAMNRRGPVAAPATSRAPANSRTPPR